LLHKFKFFNVIKNLKTY